MHKLFFLFAMSTLKHFSLVFIKSQIFIYISNRIEKTLNSVENSFVFYVLSIVMLARGFSSDRAAFPNVWIITLLLSSHHSAVLQSSSFFLPFFDCFRINIIDYAQNIQEFTQ